MKKKPMTSKQRFFWIGLLFSLPWIIGFLFFNVWPILSALYFSFTKYNIFQPPEWIGLDNYKKLFQDKHFYKSLQNTAYVTVIGVALSLIIPLLLALLLHQKVRFRPFFRTVFYLPTVTPVVASAMLFVWLLNPEYGLVNLGLELLGIRGPSWLSDPRYTKLSLLLMDTWRCGQNMIIFLSALESVPETFYEAAELDGASYWTKFRKITLPYISPTIQFLLIMGLIGYFQYFTQAFVFSSAMGTSQKISGGPRNSLLFYSLYLYQQAFSFMKMGYASAMAVVLFIIIMLISFFALRVTESRVNYDVE